MKKFFISGVRSVEDLTIRMVIQSSGLLLFDTREAQEYANFADILRKQTTGFDCYFLPGVPFAAIAPGPAHATTIIDSSSIPGGMSVLGQVLAIIDREPTPYESAICIYASGGIPALLAAGIQEELIKQITLRDRFTRGGTIEDEAIASRLLSNVAPQEDTASTLTYVLCYRDDLKRLAFVARSISDYARLVGAGRKVTVIFRYHEADDTCPDLFRFTSG